MTSRTPIACVIWAKDAQRQVADCVRAAAALPGIDPVIVCDDGSADETAKYAGAAGAIVVTHQRARGWAAAMESAVNALGILEQRDRRSEAASLLLLSATGAQPADLAPLVEPIRSGRADLTIAVPTGEAAAPGVPETAAMRGIAELTGWTPRAPLAVERCLTRRAFELTSPLAAGWGGAVSMLVDVWRAGLTVEEVELDRPRRESSLDLTERFDRAVQLAEVTRALAARGLVQAGLSEFKESGGIQGILKRFKR
ncbi:glycosyltransferase family 2 protein [Microlunatus sp. GCM10028923]|uniref:glycosyltransferase family 2 protein n=1 Tax=Microlunatus sp. GCM10028923 TaxID=3273400 RepID=UPI00360B52CB